MFCHVFLHYADSNDSRLWVSTALYLFFWSKVRVFDDLEKVISRWLIVMQKFYKMFWMMFLIFE